MVNAITASSVDIEGLQIISLALFMGPLPILLLKEESARFYPRKCDAFRIGSRFDQKLP
jgi:hypothetical protein